MGQGGPRLKLRARSLFGSREIKALGKEAFAELTDFVPLGAKP